MKQTQRWLTLALAGLAGLPAAANAKEYSHPWWLPSDYSTHGHQMDALFYWIFWITTIVLIAVTVVLVVFLIKYRYNPAKKKAVFTHGNQKLEMFWTIAPAIILAVLALGSKKVWDNYRYSDFANDPNKQTVLVIGQQFKWNTIYPGPDGQLGAYLVYPKPTDKAWSNPEVYKRARENAQLKFEGKPLKTEPLKPFMFNFTYQSPGGASESVTCAGPAFLPYDKARAAISAYIDQVNPLGKVFEDEAGLDDDWDMQPGREMIIAKDRPVEVQLGSKDVIHDFFLPNFRVKLDAVPGMRGKIHFQATKLSEDIERDSRKEYKIDDLVAFVATPAGANTLAYIDDKSPGANQDPRRKTWRYLDADKKTIVNNGQSLTAERVAKLKTAGIATVIGYQPGHFEIVCEELCGLGHGTMRGQMRVVTQQQLDTVAGKKPYEIYDKPTTLGPTTQPTTKPSAPVAMGPEF